MSEKTLQGRILQGIGGFYYARDDAGTVHTLRAQGKLRRERMKPKVGDHVELSPGEGEEHGWILRILPRRNEYRRDRGRGRGGDAGPGPDDGGQDAVERPPGGHRRAACDQ